ncbi:MAG: UDP-glucose 4-epimerase GalE [Saprospiraceae bacterium]
MKVLVTGGCGYIGSHTIVDLIANGFEVVSVDSLVNSSEETLKGVKAITGKAVQNYVVDLCDLAATRQLFLDHPDINGIIHFAALKFVGESVAQPLLYFKNNLNSLLNILACMEEFGVAHFIFSSSCSVYGNTDVLPVTEETPFQEAESPYGRTKQIGEQIIQDFAKKQTSAGFVALRYFNPSGAHPSVLLGESPINPASNLVPVITETAIGKRKEMIVFGDDYATRDGSCIRDYIHVMDLANAHTKALEYLIAAKNKTNYEVFNLGIGEGVSVLEAVNAFKKVTRQSLNYHIGPRRPGDVIAIYANATKAINLLGWAPKYSIEDIMSTAWEWEKKRTDDALS